MKDYKELEIILSDFACDKNCPYCTAKITKWPSVKDDIHLLSLNVGQLKELGYSFHYVTIGGNGEPTMHSYEKLKDIVEMFDNWDIPIKRVLTSGNIFRPENKEKYDLFVNHGWMFEVTVVGFMWEDNAKIQGYDFNYFNTESFKNSRVRLNYVLLKNNIERMPSDLTKYAALYPNIETLAVKLLNVNTYDETVIKSYSQWILDNGIPKSDREKVASILNQHFEYVGEAYDTHSWRMKIDERYSEVYFSWKKLKYGFADLVWYGNRFVNYQLESANLDLLPKVYIASRFIKDRIGDDYSFKNDFRSKLIGEECDFMNFNSHSYIIDDIPIAQYIGPFWNEKASNGELTSDSCTDVVLTENDLIEKCDIFIAYFDEILSPGGITELIYAVMLKKKIVIFFKAENDIHYSTKSSAWYPIVFSTCMNENAIVKQIDSSKQLLDEIPNILKGLG